MKEKGEIKFYSPTPLGPPPQVIPTFPDISRQFSTFPDISRQFLTFPAQFFCGNVGKNVGQLAPNFLISHLINGCESCKILWKDSLISLGSISPI